MKHSHSNLIGRAGLNCLLAASLILLAQPAQAATSLALPLTRYVSTSGTDTGECTSSLAPCRTIDYAMGQAASGDSIHIDAGIYTDVRLNVTKNLTFQGESTDSTILRGMLFYRVFTLGAGLTTDISQLTITQGMPIDPPTGGGIYQNGGVLVLSNVRVSLNSTSSCGGIYSSGQLYIQDSEISDNQASSGGGGGLCLGGSEQLVGLNRVTLRGNSALNGSGGGILAWANNEFASIQLTNVTIAGNTAKNDGGMAVGNGSVVELINSTLAGNHLSGAAGASNGGIGGHPNAPFYPRVSFQNSLIAGNEDTNCFVDFNVGWTSLGNNLDSGTTCGFSIASMHDQQNADPVLGPLADHGGAVQTMALLQGSPAINGVSFNAPNDCPSVDARGVVRPFGQFCDIGAYEANVAYVYLPVVRR